MRFCIFKCPGVISWKDAICFLSCLVSLGNSYRVRWFPIGRTVVVLIHFIHILTCPCKSYLDFHGWLKFLKPWIWGLTFLFKDPLILWSWRWGERKMWTFHVDMGKTDKQMTESMSTWLSFLGNDVNIYYHQNPCSIFW